MFYFGFTTILKHFLTKEMDMFMKDEILKNNIKIIMKRLNMDSVHMSC